MDLAGTYEKTQLIGNGDVQVWRGRNRATGNQVLLHQFTGNGRLLHLAVRYLLNRPPDSPLLAMGELPEGTCLVTNYDLELLDITAWLEATLLASRAAPGPQASPVPPAPVPPASVAPRRYRLLRNRHNSAHGLLRPRGSTGPLPCRVRWWNPRPRPSRRRRTNPVNSPEPSSFPVRPDPPRARRIHWPASRLRNLPPLRVSLRGYFRSPERQAIPAVPAHLDSERRRLRPPAPCRNGRPRRPLPENSPGCFGRPRPLPAPPGPRRATAHREASPYPPRLSPSTLCPSGGHYPLGGAEPPPPMPAGPSEYTRVIQTQRPQVPPPQSPAATSSSPVLPRPRLRKPSRFPRWPALLPRCLWFRACRLRSCLPRLP